jgi:acyl-CoA hydrolase
VELKGSRTEQNLEAAFARESQTRNSYLYYAEAAQKAGLSHVADVFLEVAQNEAEHARREFEFLGKIEDSKANLETAIRGEHYEHVVAYPEFEKTAREEGFHEIADFLDRMGKVEGRHEEALLKLLQSLDEGATPKERTVGHSATAMAQLMLPHQANPAGFVHGGELMKMMDNAAGVVAARHAGTNVVTARVENIDFQSPVRVGELVLINAALTFVSRSSMEVRVQVEAENLATKERRQALAAYFVMVALDRTGKSVEVPSLLITTEEEEKLFEEGRKRYEARRSSR